MVTIKFDPVGPIILLHVDITGRFTEKARMVLDTGATYTLIPWRIANGIGLQPEMVIDRIDLTTASGVEKAPIVNLECMRIGDLETKNVLTVVHDLPPKSYVDGLLGLSFLRNFKLNIDFKNGVLNLE